MIKNIILLKISILITLFLVEMLLRFSHVNASYTELNGIGGYQSVYSQKHKTHLCTQKENKVICENKIEFNFCRTTNSIGLPDKEWELCTEKKRIACFGDSFTEGLGASPDSSYPKILGNLLGGTYEVMNCGSSGSDPFYTLNLLKEKITQYQPDIVLFTINQTDINDVIVRGGDERFLGSQTVYKSGPGWEIYYAKSFFFRFIIHQLFGYSYQLLSPSQDAYEKERAIALINAKIDEISIFCKENNIMCYFIFHPSIYELHTLKFSYIPIIDHAQKKGYSTINIGEYFLENNIYSGKADGYFWEKDMHHNSLGYSIFAECVFKSIL